jgi:hypothetical protein
MPEIPPHDIVATRQDSVGRFAVFHEPGPGFVVPVHWGAVALDMGEDTVTIRVRIDELDDPDVPAWTARDLARLALGRQLTEVARSDDPMARRSAEHLAALHLLLQKRSGLPPARPVLTAPGAHASVYPWTVATLAGVGSIELCPGPLGNGEGVTPELLLHVLDQLLSDAARGLRADPELYTGAKLASEALREETARMLARCGDRSGAATPRPDRT